MGPHTVDVIFIIHVYIYASSKLICDNQVAMSYVSCRAAIVNGCHTRLILFNHVRS